MYIEIGLKVKLTITFEQADTLVHYLINSKFNFVIILNNLVVAWLNICRIVV